MFAGLILIAIFSTLALAGLFLVVGGDIAKKHDEKIAADVAEFNRFQSREIFTAPKFVNN